MPIPKLGGGEKEADLSDLSDLIIPKEEVDEIMKNQPKYTQHTHDETVVRWVLSRGG